MRCAYCDNNKAQVKIPNPNGEFMGKKDTWEWHVCIPCKKIINLQQKLSLLELMKMTFSKDGARGMVRKYNKMIDETQKQIDHISAEDGQETLSIIIRKKGTAKA